MEHLALSDQPTGESSNEGPMESPGGPTDPREAFDAGRVYPVIPGRLAYAAHTDDEMTRLQIESHPSLFFFSDDHQELYEPFCDDFGPVNLSVVHSFCHELREIFNQKQLAKRQVVYYSSTDLAQRTNTAFLLAAYLMIDYDVTPDEAWAPFAAIGCTAETGFGSEGADKPAFAAYRDAAMGKSTYALSVLSCLKGLHKAKSLKWYSPVDFDHEGYDDLDDPAFADMHVLCPKFVAFKGPVRRKTCVGDGVYAFTPSHYAPLLRDGLSCETVVRLNEASSYDAGVFEREGLEHFDVHFDGNQDPPREVVDRFLAVCEGRQGRVGVHCMSGLGRTGTMVAVYMMKHYGFTAAESIGWLRIARPGSVIGTQQQYLERVEAAMRSGEWEAGWGMFVGAAMTPEELKAEQSESAAACGPVSGGGNSDKESGASTQSQGSDGDESGGKNSPGSGSGQDGVKCKASHPSQEGSSTPHSEIKSLLEEAGAGGMKWVASSGRAAQRS